ncbi:MAG TPA: hypothetical protein VN581_14710 [Patescibacteria group bacterium]|nr:hypothetical protein [Patescibacteria group bacterium]
MFLALFFSAFVTNAFYLLGLLELQRALRVGAEEYWLSIGSPSGLAARDGSIMLRALFTRLLTQVCEQSGAASLLLRVRVLFVLGTTLTLVVMAWILGTQGIG